MRRLLIAAVVVLAVLAGGIAYLLLSLDAIVARAIEDRGSRLTGTAVRVGSVDLELAAGRGTLAGLEVANPEGFSPEAALRLDDMELVIDPKAVREEPLRIESLVVGSTRLRLEADGSGRSNLDQIRRHATEQGSREPPTDEEPLRLVIGKLRFAGGEILLKRPDREEPEDPVTLPPFELHQVGGRNGATGSEIGVRVLQELTRRAAVSAAGRELGRALEKELGEAGKAAGELIRDLFQQ